MTLHIVPEVGSSGKYEYKTPFDTLGNNQTEFTCMSVRRLTDCIALGEDPFKKYYKPYKLTEADYQKDIANNVSIIGLQSAVGQWLYLPNSYLLSYPDVSGVRYVTMVLAANIGAIPETLDLESLAADVGDVIRSKIGITAEIKPVITSQPALVSHDDHSRLENARKNAISTDLPLSLKIVELLSTVSQLMEQNKVLSDFIKTRNLTP